MNYVIFQMPNSMFGGIDFMNPPEADISNYLPVYRGKVSDDFYGEKDVNAILEHLFRKFNVDRPENYASRSLSIGDIVALQEGDRNTYYLCYTFGWKEIKPEKI